jgi:hypothetical protein
VPIPAKKRDLPAGFVRLTACGVYPRAPKTLRHTKGKGEKEMLNASHLSRRLRVWAAAGLSVVLILSSALPVASAASGRDKAQTAGAIVEQQPTTPPQQPGTPPAGAQPGQGPQTPPAPEKPFADLIKDAEAMEGLFTVYKTKDDKFYLEVKPDQLDKNYLIGATLESALGERGLYASQVLDDFVFSLHRLGKNIQVLQKNVRYRAADKTPMGRAVARSFADSVVVAAPVVSLPHPDRKSVLVDLSAFMVKDLPLIGWILEATYRWPYRLDAGNSAIARVKSFPQNLEVETLLNFAIDRPPVPPITPVPIPTAPPPVTTPDVRSMQFRVRYSLSTFPEGAYQPRIADDRVGHFLTMYQDFTDDRRDTPYVRYINRWNLEKSDPSAAVSTPKQPIVFWLENTIPVKYRDAIAAGVLAWNKAFEKAGFKDAVVVKQQPDDADWDPADVRYNTIRWFVSTDAGFAIGPSRANPYTGQIYDADISFTENMTRFTRLEFTDLVAPLAEQLNSNEEQMKLISDPRKRCSYAIGAMQEAAFGFGLLDARGLMNDVSAQDQYIKEFLTSIAAHEVGHTLGLRHNFRASTLHEVNKLQDSQLTTDQGLTGSVMDYTPVNLCQNGARQGQYWQTTLGPYDYWAIEYAYKPLGARTPEEELPELRKIASRAADPRLAYGTDEDSFGTSAIGLDPRTNQWDFGTDPLQFYTERIKLVHELWSNLETKAARQGEGYQTMRRGFNRGFNELAIALLNTNKYIGAVYHHRDHVGDPNGRLPYEPVPAARQRQALELIKTYAFGSKAFDFPPKLLNKLALDRFWTFEGAPFNTQRLDYPIHAQVLGIQRALLDRMFNPILLARLQDLEVKYADPKDAFTMADMFTGVQEAIWSELKTGSDINSFRRPLQREYLRRLTGMVLRPTPGAAEEAATLARYNLTQLRGRIQQALVAGARTNTATKAHLQESLARVDEALKAQQQRVVN